MQHTHLLVAAQSCTMDLHASRSFGSIAVVDLVQTEHLSRRAIELVVIDLQRGQRGVEGKFDI